jgi:hypothetical protein
MAENPCREALSEAIAEVAFEPLLAQKHVLDAAVLHTGTPGKSKKTAIRGDSLNVMLQSENPEVRALAASLMPEHIGFLSPDFVQSATASEIQKAVDATFRVPFKQGIRESFVKSLAQDGRKLSAIGARLGIYGQGFEEFSESVGRHIRGEAAPSAHVEEAAATVRKFFKDYLEEGQAAGVLSRDIPADADFLPRVFNQHAIAQLTSNSKVGVKGIRQLITKAILQEGLEVDPKVAKLIAEAYTRSIVNSAHGLEPAIVHGLNLDDVAVLRGFLEENGLSAGQIEQVIKNTTRREVEAGKVSHGKRRLKLDESTSEEFAGYGTLRIADLLENNIDILADRYSHRISAGVAFQKVLGINGTRAEIKAARNQVLAAELESGATPQKAQQRADTAEAFMRRIAGVPLFDDAPHAMSATRRATDGIRKFNFATYMVQSGFASVAEFGNVLGVGGWGLLWHGLSNFRRFRRDLQTGKVSDDLIQFFEEELGVGAENLLNPAFNRMDDFVNDAADPRNLTRGERFLNAAQQMTGEVVSQLGPMTRFQRRLIMMGVMRKIEGFATKGKKLSTGESKRLALMGLDGVKLAKIAEGMRGHQISLKSGYRNRTFTKTDLDAWKAADPETVDGLLLAIQREAHTQIIEGNIADAPLGLQTTFGKMATQFMSFAINAHTKLLVRNVELHDAQAAYSFMYSIMMASVAVQVQDFVNGVEKTPEQVVKRSVARAGHVALLPGVVDTFADIFTGQKVFDARVGGGPSNFVTGNATVSTFTNLYKLAQLPRNASADYSLSRDQSRAASALVPVVGRMVGIRYLMDEWAKDLPRATRNEDNF